MSPRRIAAITAALLSYHTSAAQPTDGPVPIFSDERVETITVEDPDGGVSVTQRRRRNLPPPLPPAVTRGPDAEAAFQERLRLERERRKLLDEQFKLQYPDAELPDFYDEDGNPLWARPAVANAAPAISTDINPPGGPEFSYPTGKGIRLPLVEGKTLASTPPDELQGFYQRLGWSLVRERVDFNGDGVTDLALQVIPPPPLPIFPPSPPSDVLWFRADYSSEKLEFARADEASGHVSFVSQGAAIGDDAVWMGYAREVFATYTDEDGWTIEPVVQYLSLRLSTAAGVRYGWLSHDFSRHHVPVDLPPADIYLGPPGAAVRAGFLGDDPRIWLRPLADNTRQGLEFETSVGFQYSVEASVDLQKWFLISSNAGENGGIVEIRFNLLRPHRNFYRVKAEAIRDP